MMWRKSNFLHPRILLNRESKKRAFILGNSPSIKSHDLSRLSECLTIGLNGSPLLEREHNFASSYYCVSDVRFMADPEKQMIATSMLSSKTIRVLRSGIVAREDAEIACRTVYVKALGRDGFSFDPEEGFYFGSSTAFLALQLAVWLGCSEIVLLGCDFNYSGTTPRFYSESNPAPEDVLVSVQVRNISNAARQLSMRNITVVNCSSISMLRPFVPSCAFETLF
jgi:hypothetical protein